MKPLVLLAFLAGLLSSGWSAPTSLPAPRPQGGRYLFVVDTSAGMKRLDLPNRQTLFDLVYFGVDHQMRSGDTFGVWTFNSKLHSGEFPMQVWDTNATLQIATRATTFLKEKRYSGKCDINPPIISLQALARTVKDLNVFILSNGESEMNGTSFDAVVNSAYKQRAAERRKAEKPFITTFIVRDGAITNAQVTLPGEKIEIPLPPPPILAKTNAPAKRGQVIAQRILDPDENSPDVRPSVQPLIMKAKPVPVSPTGNIPIDSKSFTYRATNQVQIVAAEPETNTPNLLTTTPATNTTLTPAPEISPAMLVNDGNLNPNQPSGPHHGPGEQKPSAPPATIPATTSLVSLANSTASPSTSTSAPQVPTNELAAVAQAAPLGPVTTAVGNTPKPQVVATGTPQTLLNPQLLIAVGCVLLAAALLLLFLVFRRVRRLPEPSIITRSMEKK